MKWIEGGITVALAGLTANDAAAATSKTMCCGAKLAMTFGEAGLEVRLLSVVLWSVAGAAIVVWLRALARLRKTPAAGMERPLAFLRAWTLGGPLLAISSGAYLMMNNFVAVHAYPPVASYHAYAPGLAEVSMVLWAGFLAGGVAAMTHAHLKGRVRSAS